MRYQLLAASYIMLAATGITFAENYNWNLPDWMPRPAVPTDNAMSIEKVDLGRHLFYDARLSADETIACSSCHTQARAFTDGRPRAVGINDTLTDKNAPPLMNVAYFPVLTWANPHMNSLEFQSLVPLFGEEPEEMGSAGKEDEIFGRLATDDYYKQAFTAAFPDRPAPDLFTVTRAIAAFQRSLMSFDSPYDQFKYGGKEDAISASAKRGEQLFFDHRFECYHCHQGVMFSDNFQTADSPWAEAAFHNTGLYRDYPATAPGLIEFTERAEDAGRFRTPSLRNVAVTAPYMHDGSIKDLRRVLDHYANGGREGHTMQDGMIAGFEATDQELEDLIAFLGSLTDEAFLNNAKFSDPWPEGHAASIRRIDP